MKIAMIRAEQTAEAHVKSRIILQIHDELVVEIAPGEGDQVTELVRNAMEHAVDLAVSRWTYRAASVPTGNSLHTDNF